MTSIALDKYRQVVRNATPMKTYGKVMQVVGLIIEGKGLSCSIGEICDIQTPEGPLEVEVVGFKSDRLLMMPLGEMRGIQPGSRIIAKGGRTYVTAGPGLLGRVLDGLGAPIDGKGRLEGEHVPISL